MIKVKNLIIEKPDLQIKYLEINDHTVIIGPSGAGKTTFLRCIAGMEKYAGEIYIDGELKTQVGSERGVSMAWQDGRLLPNFSVRANIELGGQPDLIDHMCNLFKVNHLLDKMPHELSGGEAQRINIIRAICSPSKVVLLDEPMQGIDPIIVRKTLKQLLHELKKCGKIALLVTHELYQVYGLFDNAIVIKHGEMIAHDELRSLYDNPLSPWMANFFGAYTVLNKEDLKSFEHHSNEDPCMVRPEWFKIKMSPFKTPLDFNATVTGVHWDGPSTKVSLVLDGTNKPLAVELYADYEIKKGDRVYVNFKKSSRPDWVLNR